MRELEALKLENERYRSKCEELEKWVLTFTNSFYEGKPQAIETMQTAIRGLEAKSMEVMQAKVAALQERKRYSELNNQYCKVLEKLKEREQYARD